MSVTSLMNMAASVQAVTWAVGTDGSESSTYATAKTCNCALQPLSAREAAIHGRPTNVRMSRIYLPLTFDNGDAMALSVGGKITVDSVAYRTISPLRNEGGRNAFFSADVEDWQ